MNQLPIGKPNNPLQLEIPELEIKFRIGS